MVKNGIAVRGIRISDERGKQIEMKKKISLILCIVMLTAVIPAEAFAGLVRGSATYSEGSVLTGGNGCRYFSSDTASLGPTGGGLMQIYYFGDDGKKHIVYSYEVEGSKHAYLLKQGGEKYRVYCFEHGLGLSDNGPTYYSKSASSHPAFAGMKKSEQQNLRYTVLYGYESDAPDKTLSTIGFFDSIYAKRDRGSYNRDDWYMATQILIWEITQEYRLSASGSDNLNYAGSSKHPVLKYGNGRNIDIHHCYNIIKGKPAEDIYRFMISMIRNRDSRPVKRSFEKETSAKASPVVLSQQEDGTWQAEVAGNPDTVRMYEAGKRDIYGNVTVKNPEGIKGKLTVTKNGRKFTVKWEAPSDSPDMTPSQATADGSRCYEIQNSIEGVSRVQGMQLWFRDTKAGNIHDQSLISGSSYQSRATYFISVTNGRSGQQDNEGERVMPAVPEFSFDVSKEDLYGGFDNDTGTARGDGSLAAGYTLYRNGEAVDSVTLDESGSTASLEDRPFDDGSAFLEQGCEYGQRIHTETDADGQVIHECTVMPTDAKWSFSVDYEIRETSVPGGMYMEPEGNTVRKFTVSYEAHAEDVRECALSDVSWSDTKITMKVDTPSGTAQLKGENDEFADEEGSFFSFSGGTFSYSGAGRGEVFRNDIHTGKIEILKENENTSVFRDKQSSGTLLSEKSQWKVYLKSGGHEGHAALRYVYDGVLDDMTAVYRVSKTGGGVSCEDTPMKVGKNGKLLVKGVPYGEYMIEEVIADDDNYVLEKFTCTVSECSTYEKYGYSGEGKYDDIYVYGVYDKLQENRVKLEKVNSETGKKVPMKGTRVRVRYMGDPSLDNPESAAGYGRLLPNGSSITSHDGSDEFVLNDAGEFVIRYDLPYGIYQVEEFCVPEGYFLGTYDENGNPSDKRYDSEENENNAVCGGIPGSEYEDLVPYYSIDSNTFQGFREVDEVLNIYTFEVGNEPVHENGNFGQMIDCDGNRSPADPSYSEEDYPYSKVYHTVKLTNSQVRGRIEILKQGEEFTGFEEAVDDKTGIRYLKAVFEKAANLAGAVFGIFAGEDILLNDGSQGPMFYSSETDEKIDIPISARTHSSSEDEAIKDILGREFTGSVYETGSAETESGGRLWRLLERKVSEENRNMSMYVTPCAGPSKLNYTYETEDSLYRYRYDVVCTMSYTPGGVNLTSVRIIKTVTGRKASATIRGGTPEVTVDDSTPYTMGGDSGNPLSSYTSGRELEGGNAASKGNELDYGYRAYVFHADGAEEEDWDGNVRDFSSLSEKRYLPSYFENYVLKEADFERETRDGVTKTSFEWKYGAVLAEDAAAGDFALIQSGGGYRVLTVSCTRNGEKLSYEENPQWVDSDSFGNAVSPSDRYVAMKQSEGWTQEAWDSTPYVLMEKGGEYIVLCTDGDSFIWNECTSEGDFENAKVEIFDIRYTQRSDNDYGFSMSFDGFDILSAADGQKAVTEISGQSETRPEIVTGAGYVHERKDGKDVFISEEREVPVYLKGEDGVKTEISTMGEWTKALVTVPLDAVSADYDIVTPQIRASRIDGEGNIEEHILDWYSKLSSDRRKHTAYESDNLIVRSYQHRGEADKDVYYTIEILTKNGSDAPCSVVYGDGYRADIYQITTDEGVNSGVIEVSNIYRTQRYAVSDLVSVITSGDDGRAVSEPLPLGTYIVRELESPAGYVPEEKSQEITLSYVNMHTPLVWKNAVFRNRYCDVQIDMKKVFENSGSFMPGSSAVFGIYTGEKLKNAKEGSLVGVISFDKNGNTSEKYRLPEGIYYVSEITAGTGYELSDEKFWFRAGEEDRPEGAVRIYSEKDGIDGSLYMKEKGKAVLTFRVSDRYPMPSFEGTDLDREFADEEITVKRYADAAVVTTVIEGNRKITMPGGKTLNVSVSDYGFEGQFDGRRISYAPKSSGYYCSASLKASAGDDKMTEVKLELSEERTITAVISREEDSYFLETAGRKIKGGEKITLQDGAYTVFDFSEDGILEMSSYYTLDEYVSPKGEAGGAECEVRSSKTQVLERQSTGTDAVPVLINAGDGPDVKPVVNRRKDVPVTPSTAPEIRTSAYYIHPGNRTAYASGSVTVTDVITYSGFDAGRTYTAEGEVIDKDCGRVLASAKKTFTADTSGSVEIEYTFDAEDMKGGEAVIFERIYLDGRLIASHTDSGDAMQTVSFPEIGTSASDALTGEKIAFAGRLTVRDNVLYSGLEKGREYTVKGELHDCKTGKEIYGTWSEKTFTAEESSGSIEITFDMDAEGLEGRSVAVFERIYCDGVLVASHEDISCAEQTVRLPMIKTSAGFERGKITDRVSYTNLIPGREYCVWGTLMDKASGKPFLIDGQKVKGYCFFIPEESDGEVTVEFPFDEDRMRGREFVVFETLYIDNRYKVAAHHDINDEKQSISVKGAVPQGVSAHVKTGIDISVFKWPTLFALMMILLIFIAVAEMRKED